jgi:dUTP pyrophosphatase
MTLTLRISRAPGYTGPLPAYQTAGASGLDLHARGGGQIAPGETFIVPTGIMVEIPDGYEGQVRGRSSLAGFGLACHLGTIDSDYRGEVCVILTHASPDGRIRGIGDGDRIAQLVIAPVARCEVVEMTAAEITPTARGAGGFGSTGAR